MRIVAWTALLSLSFAGQAWATGAMPNEADKTFLMKQSRGAAYELQSAKLAVTKASREDVKTYAEKLVHDHETFNAALEKLGRDQGLDLPTDLTEASEAHMQDLRNLNGTAFDQLYIQEALRINAEDKKDGDREKAGTKDEAIKTFLSKFDSTDQEHEKLAKQLDKNKS